LCGDALHVSLKAIVQQQEEATRVAALAVEGASYHKLFKEAAAAEIAIAQQQEERDVAEAAEIAIAQQHADEACMAAQRERGIAEATAQRQREMIVADRDAATRELAADSLYADDASAGVARKLGSSGGTVPLILSEQIGSLTPAPAPTPAPSAPPALAPTTPSPNVMACLSCCTVQSSNDWKWCKSCGGANTHGADSGSAATSAAAAVELPSSQATPIAPIKRACNACGTIQHTEVRFCGNCGSNVNSESRSASVADQGESHAAFIQRMHGGSTRGGNGGGALSIVAAASASPSTPPNGGAYHGDVTVDAGDMYGSQAVSRTESILDQNVARLLAEAAAAEQDAVTEKMEYCFDQTFSAVPVAVDGNGQTKLTQGTGFLSGKASMFFEFNFPGEGYTCKLAARYSAFDKLRDDLLKIASTELFIDPPLEEIPFPKKGGLFSLVKIKTVSVEQRRADLEEWWQTVCTVRVFRQRLALKDAIGSHACSLESSKRVTNGIPLGCPLFLPVHTVNCVQTLKVRW
jgi:hypothetical protein